MVQSLCITGAVLMAMISGTALAAEAQVVAPLGQKPGRHSASPRLLVRPNGSLVALWADGRLLCVAHSTDGARWGGAGDATEPLTLTEHLAGQFDAALDKEGNVHVIWGTRREIQYAILPNHSAGWAEIEPATIDSGAGMDSPTLCLTPAGEAWAAYGFGGTEGRVGIRASRLGSAERRHFPIAWGFTGSVQKLVVWQDQPFLVYTSDTAFGSLELYWTRFDAARQRWTPAEVGIGRCERTPGQFDVAADASGSAVRILWVTFPGSAATIRTRIFGGGDDAAGWGPAEVLASGRLASPVLVQAGGAWIAGFLSRGAIQLRTWRNGQWNEARSLDVAAAHSKIALSPQVARPSPLAALWLGTSADQPAMLFASFDW